MTREPRVLATGLGFPEGPVSLGDGAIAFVDIKHQRLARYDETGVSTIARTPGGPNGAARGADGAFYIANNGGLTAGPDGYWRTDDFGEGCIQRITSEGHITTFVTLPGDGPHRPNDCAFGPDGRLTFTDPANWEDFANLKPGRIWRAQHDGTPVLLAEVEMFPNGLAFGPGGDVLYVCQTLTQTVLAFDVRDGALSNRRVAAKLPAGFPDGMCITADGDLVVCGSMGDLICIFDADGALKETIRCPEHSEPTNACLDDGVLFVTMSGAGELVSFDVGWEALPLYE